MPELRHLRVFVVVGEELNFTRAAERLFLSQQAVSKSVGQLERELGVPLLERSTHAVALTPAGAALLDPCRAALGAIDAALADARAVGRSERGTVRVGVTPAVGAAVRRDILRVLRDGAPELAISVREVRPGEIGALLRDRALDLAFARTAPRLADVESAALRPTPAMLLVPAGHRLAGTGPVRLAELDGERLLTWNPVGTPYTDMLVTRLAAAGARVEPVESLVTGGGEPPALADQDAIALMPEGSPVGDATVPVPLAEPVDLPLLVLWPTGAPSPAVRRARAGLGAADGR